MSLPNPQSENITPDTAHHKAHHHHRETHIPASNTSSRTVVATRTNTVVAGTDLLKGLLRKPRCFFSCIYTNQLTTMMLVSGQGYAPPPRACLTATFIATELQTYLLICVFALLLKAGPPPPPPSQQQYYGPQFQGAGGQQSQPFFQYSQCNGNRKALCVCTFPSAHLVFACS